MESENYLRGKATEREMLNVFLTQFCENMRAAKRLLGS